MNKTTVQISKDAKAKFDMIKAKFVAQGKSLSTDLQFFDYLADLQLELFSSITPDDMSSVENLIKNQINLKFLINEKAKNIKIILTDVDGVLSDGGRYYSKNGEIIKKFHTRDGMGVNVLLRNKIKTVIVTKETSPIVKKWAKDMNISHIYNGVIKKESILTKVCKTFKVMPSEIAYIGDDINDLELMKKVGFSGTPKNSDFSTKKIVDYICENNAGQTAFREFADIILYSKFPDKTKWY
ncbi:3-deoxy-D-manno-octulosonate 8-phosphate phosphatase KdsC protein [Marine Group I thaumarchaeote SCGC AAA799-P11]|uniref:3-deoxy-D-manno-octulosonate 8-phosphate phosphatase KdsC n=1 Tax=Marine Group I thaumarchaeote SCGC AAA799-P11 TaxID=1502295 RepID=A0A087S311_9ARCH|nr:3-deoxy-D-manno-octulosonate 8-phosphate phosphatase KdsC protein [Marine Group I thaumarchaeote SCGC AAA799-P11]